MGRRSAPSSTTAKNCGALARVSTACRAIRAATRLSSSASEMVGAMPWMSDFAYSAVCSRPGTTSAS